MAPTKARADAPLDGPNRDSGDPENSWDENTSLFLTPTEPVVSRRERRKARKHLTLPTSSTPPTREPSADAETDPKPTPSVRVRSPQPSIPRTPTMPPGNPLPLFIASIGNPPPKYTHTLHSAGHTVLACIALHLSFTPFTKSRPLANGLVARPDTRNTSSRFLIPKLRSTPEGQLAPNQEDWTLWQSPSLMNVSGKAVRDAWKVWSREKSGQGVLVVLHDELESEMGKVRVRRGGSARGHNGLKSLAAALPGQEVVRVGIGIGRPASREAGVVSSYVLRRMSERERGVIEGAAGEVIFALRDIAEGRR